MSESLRNDGRVWVPKSQEDAQAIQKGKKTALDIPDSERDYFLERRYPAFGNLVPRDVASRAAKVECDKGLGVSPTGLAVFLDFSSAIERYGKSEAHSKGMNASKEQIIATILAGKSNVVQQEKGSVYAPVNIALCKYWGKRDSALN
ncbi:MAG TPA: hypothetical protein PKD18_03895, partial [Saprospiraceae bacterium]|nr:hypothetical protein [Saprospiraceae bacterium]